jgi:hypothetical protein
LEAFGSLNVYFADLSFQCQNSPNEGKQSASKGFQKLSNSESGAINKINKTIRSAKQFVG